ncbi:GNAT family N-acetyltransferase [uncultured Thomasclavelia sp.]|uniref:GNAT family N-acetyltransferase n=1 Tax=uncultured Thomasclavelia sp. TaxID=3025759 RepID=UPI0025E52F3F|nr:GNAT family N-acetyltransferase [uncultured Thomasclavelia sp.]
MIEFYQAKKENIDLLVKIRVRDLEMFSNQKIELETIKNIRRFYLNKLNDHSLITLLCYKNRELIGSGTIYFYDVIPSNINSKGIMGQITNVYIDENYRHQGIGTMLIRQLLELAQPRCNVVCLNSSKEALKLYQKCGFEFKDRYMIKYIDGNDG